MFLVDSSKAMHTLATMLLFLTCKNLAKNMLSSPDESWSDTSHLSSAMAVAAVLMEVGGDVRDTY